MQKFKWFTFLFLLAFACSTINDLPTSANSEEWKVKKIEPSKQQTDGNPEKGLEFLIYGDYIGSGIPFDFYKDQLLEKADTVLKRNGNNSHLPYLLNAFEAENGVEVVSGNCFTCHAAEMNGEIILGLGNSFSDYERNWSRFAYFINLGIKLKYKKDDPEREAYENFGNFFKVMAPTIETNQAGMNPAFRLAEACMNYRNPVDLRFQEKPNYEMTEYPIATDVPPLWNVKKKNALYYTAIGRGDFTKLLFQASVLGIPDSTSARKAVNGFKDVLAYLKKLEAPKYPGVINRAKAEKGKEVFESNCSKCHGTYGEEETYPNKVVALSIIKTDPAYAYYVYQSGITEWYNNSWFANSKPKSYFEPTLGYIAPPLDGIWATAPYLHNGSVPTVEDLLKSAQRPVYWHRNAEQTKYDHKKLGWKYKKLDNAKEKWTFDTTLPAYTNVGHYFGDKLSDEQRENVIEYLKTL